MDIQWQQAQGLFQTVLTLNLATSILISYMNSVENIVLKAKEEAGSKIHGMMDNTLIIKMAVWNGEWRGPNIFEKLWREYEEIREKVDIASRGFERLEEKLSREKTAYVTFAIVIGIQFVLYLFYSTLHPLQLLPIAWVWSFGVTGFVPPLVALGRIPWWYYRLGKAHTSIVKLSLFMDPGLNIPSSETGDVNDRPNVQIHQYKARRGLKI
jgi:Arsenical pump membrane protein